MSDLSLNSLSNFSGLFDQNNLGIFSLFSNYPKESQFNQAITGDSDFARILIAQMQNSSLKILGVFGGEESTNSFFGQTENFYGGNVSSFDLTSAFSPATGSDFLGYSSSVGEEQNIFTEQILSLLRLNQIKVFQSLVGKKVRATDLNGKVIEGVVENIIWQNNRFVFTVNGEKVYPENITEVLS